MKAKIFFMLAVGVFCAVFLLGCACLVGADKFCVELPNRKFKPPPGLDPQLQQQLAKTDSFPVHALVQLVRLPNNDERESLRTKGVLLMQNIKKTVFLTDLSKDFEFKAVSDLVRWAGPLFPEDKIEHWFWDTKVRKYKSTNGKVKIVVQFYRNVPPDTVNMVLSKYTDGLCGSGGDNFWGAETSYDRLMGLATEPSVRWIQEQVPNFLPVTR